MNALTIAAPVSGKLLGWAGSPVRVVSAGEFLGEVESAADGGRHELRAPADGSFWATARAGAAVEKDAALATLQPSRTAADAPRAPVEARAAILPAPAAPRPAAPPVEREAGIVERSAPVLSPSPPVEVERPPTPSPARVERRGPPIMRELTMSPDARKRPLPPAPEQEKLERKTYYLTPGQMARIRALSDELTMAEDEARAGESEILRAAVELLLALPRPALIATLKDNRERERRGRYGSGYPRPGRPPKRK